MATHNLIKKKTRSFLTQQFNTFYPLKYSKSLVFRTFSLEPLNPSERFSEIFYYIYLLSYSLRFFYFLFFFSCILQRPNHLGGRGLCPPNFNFQTKEGSTVSVSNIMGIAFYRCSEIKRTRNFTIFTVYATFFGPFTADFCFFQLHKRK